MVQEPPGSGPSKINTYSMTKLSSASEALLLWSRSLVGVFLRDYDSAHTLSMCICAELKGNHKYQKKINCFTWLALTSRLPIQFSVTGGEKMQQKIKNKKRIKLARLLHDGLILLEHLRWWDNGSATLSTIFKIISTAVLRNAVQCSPQVFV